MTLPRTNLPGCPPGMNQTAGRAFPMGATVEAGGVNFAVFSANAHLIELCLFSEDGRHEIARLLFTERDGDVWHMRVEGMEQGQRYGLRAHGPYAPEDGHRFNPHKLLMDPYARAYDGRLRWSDALMGYRIGSAKSDLSYDTRDSAFAVPKSVVVRDQVVGDPVSGGHEKPLRRSWSDTVIYEAHVKGLTARHPKLPIAQRGRYLGLAAPEMIEHYQQLGVTAIELLPVQAFFDERFLVARGLTNYWGYNTMGFFAPEPRYSGRHALAEFREMVRRLHAAGIEVLLDVVYNHTGEGDDFGPTLNFRGLDNRSYYRLTGGGRHYVNDSGTGNTLNINHPMVLRMVMDSLRYWVEHCHVDGFRFDLATALGREAHGFDLGAGFFDAIRQDPVLANVKLIAEPWDIGPGGYQLGAFPHPFGEWNDRFRDGVRRVWRGDAGMAPDLAKRLLGTADAFDHDGRAATSSVNFLTAHDGFTLQDLVSFTVKRNLDNGEDNRDGHSENYSDNLGIEGPTTDPVIRAARALRKRNLLATLFLSQGVPMLLAGDEVGHSQTGNNNAYAQDNETTWIDWAKADAGLAAFVGQLTALRASHPVLRQKNFLHGRQRDRDPFPDVIWRRADGNIPEPGQWHDPAFRCLGLELRMSAKVLPQPDIVFMVFNMGPEQVLTLPATAPVWRMVLDTTRPDGAVVPAISGMLLPANSVTVFIPDTTGGPL